MRDYERARGRESVKNTFSFVCGVKQNKFLKIGGDENSSVNESNLTSDGFLTPKEYRCSKYTPFFFGVREYVKDNPPDWVSL